jgi:hypothetical protein
VDAEVHGPLNAEILHVYVGGVDVLPTLEPEQVDYLEDRVIDDFAQTWEVR